MWKFESTKPCVIDNSFYWRNNPVSSGFQELLKRKQKDCKYINKGKILRHKQKATKLREKFCWENKRLPYKFRLVLLLTLRTGVLSPFSPCVPIPGLRQRRVSTIPWHIETDLFLNRQQIENPSPISPLQSWQLYTVHTPSHARRGGEKKWSPAI